MAHIEAAWVAIPKETVRASCEAVPHRMKAIAKAKGGRIGQYFCQSIYKVA